ncbi:MAG: SufE family protein, partial [Verrucomicrobiae bacterium]|nr:SufE family protein [Verrucomicrobiae bacterium]
EENLVPGCLSRLWLQPRCEEGRCGFRCDSDSLVVKALAVTLCGLFEGATPAAILSLPDDFLERTNLRRLLTSNRQDTLRRVWDSVRSFAAEVQATAATPPSGLRE